MFGCCDTARREKDRLGSLSVHRNAKNNESLSAILGHDVDASGRTPFQEGEPITHNILATRRLHPLFPSNAAQQALSRLSCLSNLVILVESSSFTCK